MTGASWSLQFIAAVSALGFGALAALPALLFKLKISGFEKIIADFCTILALTGLFILSVHLGAEGQPTFYGFACFVVGLCAAYKPLSAAADAVIGKLRAGAAARRERRSGRARVRSRKTSLP